MGPFGLLHGAVDALKEAPGVRHARRAAADRTFSNNVRANLFRGVFDSAQAAMASAPPTRPTTYDNEGSANLYVDRLRVDDYDYPAMFWLQRSFAEGLTQIADVGGSIGIKYFAFHEFMPYPSNLLWRVIDMPAVAQRGRDFASTRGAAGALQFSSEIGDVDGMQVLYASGVLQYLPQTLAEILAGLARKPRRIIVNTIPIHPTKSFFTLNSIGTAFCAYRVQSHEEFVGAVTAQGYELRHEWRNIGKPLRLPFEQGYGLEDYTGFCFEAVD